jgi:capsular exopolysaccharide synthesis family protein
MEEHRNEPLAIAAQSAPEPSGAEWKSRVQVVPAHIPTGSPLLPFDGRDPRSAEHYRIIRTKILQDPRRLRVLAVTSPQVGDGKSVSAVNIAAAMALRDGASVLLVDADFRRSGLHVRLGLPDLPGLAEVLAGECSLEQAVIRVSEVTPSFYFLPAGRATRNPVELFASERLALRCAEIRREFDFAVIDTPPIGLVADYELVEVVSDGVILVVRPDHTSRRRGFAALQSIPKERLIGVVTNCVQDWFLTKSLYHDYGYYGGRSG